MNERVPEQLYALLPEILRNRDLDADEQLRALMLVLQRVFDTVQQDIDVLYDDLFIETCRATLLPYVGDAVGADLRTDDNSATLRAWVANYVSLRRRMGTLGAVERAATDLTGWPARAVEPATVLRTTLPLSRAGRGNPALVDLRDEVALANRGGPFDTLPRSVDVGRAGSGATVVGEGIGMPDQLGLYLWRLPVQPLEMVVASCAADRKDATDMCFSVCTVPGMDIPLFRPPVTRPEDGARLERSALPARLELADRWDAQPLPVRLWLQTGSDPGLLTPVDPADVVVADLSSWAPGDVGDAKAVVDVERGRIKLVGSAPKALRVSFAAAAPGNLGAGSYPRPTRNPEAPFLVYRIGPWASEQLKLPEDPQEWPEDASGLRGAFPGLSEALSRYDRDGKPADAWFEIVDSGTYTCSSWTSLDLSGRRVVIYAPPGQRPTILGDLAAAADGDAPGHLVLDGLLWAGRIGLFGHLQAHICHCTIKPTDVLTSAPPVETTDAPAALLSLRITHSIVGAIRAGRGQGRLVVEDTVVDGSRAYGFGVASAVELPRHAAASAWIGVPDGAFALRGPSAQEASDSAAGPPTLMRRTTVLGEVDVVGMEAVDTLFNGRLTVRERYRGTLSHCFVPRGSSTPARVRCVDDRVQDTSDGGRLPMFESLYWPQPGYAWLRRTTSPRVRSGATNGSEMGALSTEQITAREDRLERVLDGIVPLTLRAAVVYVT